MCNDKPDAISRQDRQDRQGRQDRPCLKTAPCCLPHVARRVNTLHPATVQLVSNYCTD